MNLLTQVPYLAPEVPSLGMDVGHWVVGSNTESLANCRELTQALTESKGPPPVPRASQVHLPADVFVQTTGPASQSYRRAAGGTQFWEPNETQNWMQTTRWPSQRDTNEVRTIWRPEEIELNLQSSKEMSELKYADIQKWGSIDADWFDLLTAMHLDGYDRRSRDQPSTWTMVRTDSLRRMQVRGRYKGFRTAEEVRDHTDALGRVLRAELFWPKAADRARCDGITFPYFHANKLHGSFGTACGRQVLAFAIYPTWWFDVEMSIETEGTSMMTRAGLKLVLQIPSNKSVAKAAARYLVNGFWRQRAGHPGRNRERRYFCSLREFFDRAGIAVPEWASTSPAKYAEDLTNQLFALSKNGPAESAILAFPTIKPPDRKSGAFERWMRQEVEWLVHPNSPLELRDTIRALEVRAERTSGKLERRKELAAVRALAAAKKKKP